MWWSKYNKMANGMIGLKEKLKKMKTYLTVLNRELFCQYQEEANFKANKRIRQAREEFKGLFRLGSEIKFI